MLRNCGHLERLCLDFWGVCLLLQLPTLLQEPQKTTWYVNICPSLLCLALWGSSSSWASFSDFSFIHFPPCGPELQCLPQCFTLFGSQSHKEVWKRIPARIKKKNKINCLCNDSGSRFENHKHRETNLALEATEVGGVEVSRCYNV